MIKCIVNALLIDLLITASLSAQPDNGVDSLLLVGDQLMQQGKFDESISFFEEAIDRAEKSHQWGNVYDFENKILENLWRSYRLDIADEKIRAIAPGIKEKLGSNSIQLGNLWSNKGTIFFLRGTYDSAIEYYSRSLKIFKLQKKVPLGRISGILNNMGNIYLRNDNLDSALINYQRSLEIDKEFFGEEHEYVAIGLSNIGAVYIESYLHHSALETLAEALQIARQQNTKGLYYYEVLVNLGLTYNYLGEYEKAHDCFAEVLGAYESWYSKDHSSLIEVQIRIAENLNDQDLHDSSKFYLNKISNIEIKASNDLDLYYSYIRALGGVESDLEHYDQALNLYRTAIQEITKVDKYAFRINHLRNLAGLNYLKLNELSKAEETFSTVIEQYKNSSYPENILIAPYQNLAKVFRKQGKTEEALQMVNNSLEVNLTENELDSIDLDTIFSHTISKLSFILSMEEKALILHEQIADSPKSSNKLQEILEIYDILNDAIQQYRRSFLSNADKRQLEESTKSILLNAVLTAYELYQLTNDEKYLEKCFLFSESSHSSVLSDAISSITALSELSAVPEGILRAQASLEERSNRAINSLYEEKRKAHQNQDLEKIKIYQSRVFDIKQSQDSLVKLLEIQYPGYYHRRYADSKISVGEIQNGLKQNETLIEYFVRDSVCLAFVIGKNDADMIKLSSAQKVKYLIQSFRKSIDNFPSDPLGSQKELDKISHELYVHLWQPFEGKIQPDKIKKLYIIPDRELGYLPFEALKTKSTDGTSYLIRNYEMSYGYSAELLLNYPFNKKSDQTNSVQAFAPSYPLEKQSNERGDERYKFRDAIVPLLWNENEVNSIESYFETNIYVANEATEKNFKNHSSKSPIIHLAMHALIDEDDPIHSKLVFYQDQDSIEDGYLHTYELFNMKLEADLVVLSACQTGDGKLVAGEGIVSLARGFAYAGVPSVVMTHWQVDDQSTSLLMKSFYKFLSEGLSKSAALREAKLQYLQETDPNKLYPFFWAPFVVIGDDAPILEENYNLWYLIIGTGLILFLIWLRRRNLFKNRLT